MIHRRFIWAAMFSDTTVYRIVSVFGLGKSKFAPGTLGSVVGLLWFITFVMNASPIVQVVLVLVTIYLAAAFVEEAEIRQGAKDPSWIILDEVVAVPVCFLGLNPLTDVSVNYLHFILGFIIFRVMDIWKPLFIKQVQRFQGGWAVVADDILAALFTLIFLRILHHTGAISYLKEILIS